MYKLSDLLIWQYRGKPKAKKTIDALAQECDTVFKSAVEVAKLLNIDEATGYALDLVGKHVGVSRSLPAYIDRVYFGWKDDPSAAGFGVGEWHRYGSQLRDPILMSDEDYRFFIKAKILKNYQIADLGDIIDSVKFLFGENANIVDGYNMTMTVILPFKQLTALQIYAIRNMDILRRPVGVMYHYLQTDAYKPFGWAHDPTAYGFNDGTWSRFIT